MKLFFWIPALSGRGGGAERVLSLVSSGLARRGHEVLVASADEPAAPSFYSFDPAIQRIGVDANGGRAAWNPSAIVWLRSQLHRIHPDVAIGFMFAGYATLAAAAAGTRLPVIASEHTAYDHYRRHPLQAGLLRAWARRFAAMTIPSDRVRLGYPKAVADRMTVIPNPVTIAPSDGITPATAGRRRRLLAVGNLREEKGHSVLLDAFSRIAATHPDWDLRIVGEGPLRAALERIILDAGLTGRAEISNVVADIAGEYRHADLFVMPSAYESFGLATAEALAAGVPAIGFADCPGTNEIIRDGVNGLLVKGRVRADALAGGLDRMMRSPELLEQFAARAPDTVADYDAEGIILRWEKLLQSVVSMRASSRLTAV